MIGVRANDFLIGSTREQRMQHVSVMPRTSAVIPRGTVLARGTNNFTVLTAENVANAEVIAAEDIPAGSEAVNAPVYVSGDFIEQGMTADADLTDEARLNLKNAGIYLINGMEQ